MSTIDNATFRALNGDAPIYPEKANYWVIVVRRSDLLGMSEKERLSTANQVVTDFFRHFVMRHKELRALDVWPAKGVPTGTRYALVQPQPMVYPDGSVFLSLTWDADDSRDSIPWPWEYGIGGWQDVREGLVSVHQPGSIVEVPDALDNVVTAATNTAEQMGKEIGSGLSLGTGAAIAILAGLLLWGRR